jgi:carbon monoxide dehydrogenase subunit G
VALTLTHHFPLTRPIDETFAIVVDLERLVPCVEGGRVLRKTGADSVEAEIEIGMAGTSMTFRGSVELVEHDADRYHAVVNVASSEISGQGDANARVEFLLTDAGGTINTTAELSGTPMSMGESIPLGILDAMVADFAESLSEL